LTWLLRRVRSSSSSPGLTVADGTGVGFVLEATPRAGRTATVSVGANGATTSTPGATE
jgi:hypothetical protein